MPDRIVPVRKMVIDKKPQEIPPLTLGEKTEEKMQKWTHERCKTVLTVPVVDKMSFAQVVTHTSQSDQKEKVCIQTKSAEKNPPRMDWED